MTLSAKSSDLLLEKIRQGASLSSREKLNLIIGLSIPSILAQITSVLMFFIDASMVGHLGAEASASIGIVETSTWLFGSMTTAASMGFSVQVAHFIGANDFQRARDVFRHALIATTILSLILLVIGVAIAFPLPYWLGGGDDIARDASLYFLIFALTGPFFQLANLSGAMLKCSGNMRIPSIMSVMMCVLDVVFNFFFIYIIGWGVVGAAIGTSLAIIISALGQAYFAIVRSPMLALRQDHTPFRWNPAYIHNAAKIGAPMALQSVLMGGAQIVGTRIVAPLGNVSIAANSFAITVESLCYMPGYGIGDAATTLVGQSRGARRFDICRSFAWMTIGVAMLVMAFMGMLMFIFAPELMAILTPVAEIKDLGALVLRIEAFAEPMFAAAIVSYSICVGAGDTLRPAMLNLFSMWCVRLTLAAVLARDYGLKGVWIAMAVELTCRGTLFLIRIWRGNWMKKVLQ
ncbi:MAG: MATE family efflux transporter [Prevotella sp.]|nr:MATE family efflux transporter [Prevotella sp.]MBR1518564.1 MATE family efflux transporter [Prevotella sp.]